MFVLKINYCIPRADSRFPVLEGFRAAVQVNVPSISDPPSTDGARRVH